MGLGIIILGFSFSGLIYFIYAYTGSPLTWQQAFRIGLTQWYSWTLLGSLIVKQLTARLPIERQRWVRGVLLYAVIGVAFAILKFGLDLGLIRLFYQGEVVNSASASSLYTMMLYFNLVTYATFVGIGHAYNFYRRFRDRELKASQLEAQLAQAQLQALKMQLHPHFLFNTLHTIAMLNLKDPKAANRMISRLSDLLRLTLENIGAQEVPLKQELDFLKQYLEIEQVRFQDRLTVHLEIDPQTLDARVPNLILQPIVENALRHGIAEQEEGGRIELFVKRVDGSLRLTVRDNGPGISDGDKVRLRRGIGLTNTQKRLEQLYGTAHRFELGNADGGGLEVSITLPFREEEQAETNQNRVDDE